MPRNAEHWSISSSPSRGVLDNTAPGAMEASSATPACAAPRPSAVSGAFPGSPYHGRSIRSATGMAAVAARHVFHAAQRFVRPGDIGHVGCGAFRMEHRTGLLVHTDARFHPDAIRMDLLRLAHARIPSTALGARRNRTRQRSRHPRSCRTRPRRRPVHRARTTAAEWERAASPPADRVAYACARRCTARRRHCVASRSI